MINHNVRKNVRNIAVIAVAALGVTALEGQHKGTHSASNSRHGLIVPKHDMNNTPAGVPGESKGVSGSDRHPYIPLHPGIVTSETAPVPPESYSAPVHIAGIPKSIPKNRFNVKSVSTGKPEEVERFPLVAPDEFVNVDLNRATREVEDQYKQAKKAGYGPNAKFGIPQVPVYIEDKAAGGPVEVPFSYIPGSKEFIASVTIDMPTGVDAQHTIYYAFFNGERHDLSATFTSPDPGQEPNYLDNINLAIPKSVDIPRAPAY